MKKFLVALLFTIPVATIAEEDFGMKVPAWKDFAPSAYIEVKEPKGLIGKLNVTAKYWYDRKIDFEENLERCKSIQFYEERFSCYEDLKSKQYRANTDYNARIEAKDNITGGIPEMMDRTDSMIPVGSYLNNFSHMMPNEIRGY